jgi:NADPH:quinone reductase-like Zn-dependent oxidoreductase
MKAIVYEQYGSPDVLEFKEIATPAPADDEVLVKVYAASVNTLDRAGLSGPLFARPMIGGLLKPKYKILGSDIAGRVEAAGRDVKQFRPGDEVFGAKNWFGGRRLGGFAEYVCAVEEELALKPANISFEQAAAVSVAGLTALQGLRDKGRIRPGQKVLVDGASGGVGTFAVQIAKSFGAEVTAVCSTRNVETARSIGADHVIDYKREDFTWSGQGYDLILAANGHRSIFAYRRALRRDGIYVMVGGGLFQILQALLLGPLLSLMGSKKMCMVMAKLSKEDLVVLGELLGAGKVIPVIDRRYPLSGVAEAFRYLEAEHARGKVVIDVALGDGAQKAATPDRDS